MIYIPVSQLVPEVRSREYNPNFRTLCKSIGKSGILNILLIHLRTNIIIDGYWRYYAAKEVGLRIVPCMMYDITLEQLEAYYELRGR